MFFFASPRTSDDDEIYVASASSYDLQSNSPTPAKRRLRFATLMEVSDGTGSESRRLCAESRAEKGAKKIRTFSCSGKIDATRKIFLLSTRIQSRDLQLCRSVNEDFLLYSPKCEDN